MLKSADSRDNLSICSYLCGMNENNRVALKKFFALNNALKYLFVFMAVVFVCASCKKERIDKDGIINEQLMEDVLYDYQLAQALAREEASADSVAILEYQYSQAVFTKHGITSSQFERSLGRYSRDHKKMLALTKAVEQRFEDEVKAESDALAADRRNKFAQQTDTLIVWENQEGVILDVNGRNTFVVDIPGKEFEGCDRVSFGVNTAWVYRESQRVAMAVLSVIYDNDSVDVHTQAIRDERHIQSVNAYINQQRKVKNVMVRVYQNSPWADYMQKLALTNMFVWSIKSKDDE